MVDNHAYFQNKSDQTTSILKNEENRPLHWMHKPTPSEVEEFEKIIPGYEQLAKKTRMKLISKWIAEELSKSGDPVTQLQWLRTSQLSETDIWPCYRCSAVGEEFA